MSTNDDIYQSLTIHGVFSPTDFFPFIEDEHGDITGPGHQDAAAFRLAVDAYYKACGVDITIFDIVPKHCWGFVNTDDHGEIYIRFVTGRHVRGAVPLTRALF